MAYMISVAHRLTRAAIGGIVVIAGASYLVRKQRPDKNYGAARNAAAHTPSERQDYTGKRKATNTRAGEEALDSQRTE
jgi:hypothetical protein